MEEKKIQEKKLEAVAFLKDRFEKVQDYFFTDYRGLTVSQITELRGKLREKGAEYRVVKNNYAKIAFGQLEHQGLEDYLVGPTAIALAGDDSGAVAKVLLEFEKDSPMEVKGGLIAGDLFDIEQVKAYSKLPGREQLVAMLMGTMQAPLQNFVFACNGITTKLVRTMQAVADKKQAES